MKPSPRERQTCEGLFTTFKGIDAWRIATRPTHGTSFAHPAVVAMIFGCTLRRGFLAIRHGQQHLIAVRQSYG